MGKFVVHNIRKIANIEPLPGARNWMDETPEKHAYMCFPLSLTNRLGWGISYPKDIRVIWDGVTDTTPDHVKILEGEEYVSTGRGNATLSFFTGMLIKTDELTSTVAMPVPNLFVRGAHCYTTTISTSFYVHELPLAWRITEPNVEIHIPAGQPVAAILPLSLTNLQENYTMEYIEDPMPTTYWEETKKYGDAAQIKNGVGDWSRMYREGLNYDGKKIGDHELKALRLKTVTCPFTGQSYEVQEEEQSGGHPEN
jgi:hypothetical protein